MPQTWKTTPDKTSRSQANDSPSVDPIRFAENSPRRHSEAFALQLLHRDEALPGLRRKSLPWFLFVAKIWVWVRRKKNQTAEVLVLCSIYQGSNLVPMDPQPFCAVVQRRLRVKIPEWFRGRSPAFLLSEVFGCVCSTKKEWTPTYWAKSSNGLGYHKATFSRPQLPLSTAQVGEKRLRPLFGANRLVWVFGDEPAKNGVYNHMTIHPYRHYMQKGCRNTFFS